jgi:hypothetical protein
MRSQKYREEDSSDLARAKAFSDSQEAERVQAAEADLKLSVGSEDEPVMKEVLLTRND